MARREGFAPKVGDVAIDRQTERQGIWLAWLGTEPIGCITGVRYNAADGLIGLYMVASPWRGQGYGQERWHHAMDHLSDLPCIGLEAAPDLVKLYGSWGFAPTSATVRWQTIRDGDSLQSPPLPKPWQLLADSAIPQIAVQRVDAPREPSPRPHFLAHWLNHPAASVLAHCPVDGGEHRGGRAVTASVAAAPPRCGSIAGAVGFQLDQPHHSCVPR
jgi:ribosomal-protein-alanine N-acetyltransferase